MFGNAKYFLNVLNAVIFLVNKINERSRDAAKTSAP